MSSQNSVYDLASLPWMLPVWQQWQQLQGRLGHAYLLNMPNGIGGEQLVAAMAQQALCQQPTAKGACGQCSTCQLFASGQHPDYYHLQRLEDKKEIAVDQVRQLLEKQSETSHQGGYKLIWVEGVEDLNISAFNALLKTLEEPSEQTLFLLSCAQASKLPATIKSRCQKLTVNLPELPIAMEWLQQQRPQLDQALLKRALRLNWGAPLDALRWIDEGRIQEYSEWQEGLRLLKEFKKTPSKVATPWLKWSQPERVFDYFYHWALMQVRSQAYSAEHPDTSKVRALLQFQQQVMQAKAFWMGNANKELILENLLSVWLKLQNPVAEACEPMFKPTLNRGLL
ncbi:DNA polymerase III subunit delta' [Thiomicrorhabdus sp. 6S3-12]|uniref:DNA polymerase III subunit delta' n=1 Tax=Thiomicrorhabdus sp. 6S3-12 TaxID=2819681 RepID=UPI001AAD7A00|nr:DNA polymerase III subunit delta' [Thiomicrorhabdus sp. 6S3-12]MBO1924188.1 DNA polymerase III subunit delta' [Thiomicrorhabdus sp. 6S3-12]